MALGKVRFVSFSVIKLTGHFSCQAALKNGHVSCASLLVGDLGTWQGLLTLGGSSFGGL